MASVWTQHLAGHCCPASTRRPPTIGAFDMTYEQAAEFARIESESSFAKGTEILDVFARNAVKTCKIPKHTCTLTAMRGASRTRVIGRVTAPVEGHGLTIRT